MIKRIFFEWTVILRGRFVRNFINMCKRLFWIFIVFAKIVFYIMNLLLTVILWIIGINWFDVSGKIRRAIRIYFT